MERLGEITAVKGDRIEVTFCHQEDCGHCHACENGQRVSAVTLKGHGQVGDFAAVELPTSTVVKASLLAYVIPLCALLLGLFLGRMVLPSDPNIGSAVGGMVLLLIAVFAVAFGEKSRQKSSKWQPVLNRVIPRELRDGAQEDKA